MGDEYTPTTEEIRIGHAQGTYCTTGHQAAYAVTTLNAAQELFDRWLAGHDREVAAKAWTEGLHKAYNHVDRLEQADAAGQGVTISDPVNPYRRVSS